MEARKLLQIEAYASPDSIEALKLILNRWEQKWASDLVYCIVKNQDVYEPGSSDTAEQFLRAIQNYERAHYASRSDPQISSGESERQDSQKFDAKGGGRDELL
jgi:hypothetical protein